jgi:hypothetical protein
MSMRKLVEARLYSCRYANTFSIVIACADIDAARSLFAQWLSEHHDVDDPQLARMTVRVKHSGITAPLYIEAA